jgi:hypothetical protein
VWRRSQLRLYCTASNDGQLKIWQEAVTVYFQAESRHLSGGNAWKPSVRIAGLQAENWTRGLRIKESYHSATTYDSGLFESAQAIRRCLWIINEKKTPKKTTDASFKKFIWKCWKSPQKSGQLIFTRNANLYPPEYEAIHRDVCLIPCRGEFNLLFNPLKHSGMYIYHLLHHSVTLHFSTKCTYRFRMIIGLNSILFP